MAAASLDGFIRRLQRSAGADAFAALTDGQLVEVFLAERDAAAFNAILGRHGLMVHRVCRRVLGDGQDVEDAFQAVFLVLVRRAATIRKHASLASWLHGVAHQVALRVRTSSRRRRDREARAAHLGEAARSESWSWAEVQKVLDEELARLSAAQRAPLVLCYLEGLTQDEAARQLGQAKSTFRRRLERGRRLLRARLARRGMAMSAGLAGIMVSDCAAAGVPPAVLDSTIRTAAVAAGHAGGIVPAGISKLAAEVIRAMYITRLITGGLFLTTIVFGTLTGLAVILHAGGQASAARAATTVPFVSLLVAPTIGAPADLKMDFDKLCELRNDEVLKRIAPPFPECRHEYVRKTGAFDKDSLFTAEDTRMVVLWNGKKATSSFLRVGLKGPDMAPPRWLTVRDLVEYTTGLSAFELEGDEQLLSTEAPGDYVVREGATVDKVLPRLEAILRTECKLTMKLQVTEAEREVVVVRGKFASVPRPERQKNEIDVFSRQPIADSGAGGGSGDLARFLRGVEAFTGKRIVSDVELGPTGTLSWYFHARSPFTAEQRAEDTNPELVFKTIAAQTGLEFKTEKRKVRVVRVEKTEK